MTDQFVHVECYSGFKAEERPVRIVFGSQSLKVTEVEDHWYSPAATFFRLLVESGDRYVLRRDHAQGIWSLTAFRAAGNRVDTKIIHRV